MLQNLYACSLQEPPYVMFKKSEYVLKGNDRFEGFCVELLQEIAELVGFKYRIELVPDGKYGAPNKDGEWNGMVKQIVERVGAIILA